LNIPGFLSISQSLIELGYRRKSTPGVWKSTIRSDYNPGRGLYCFGFITPVGAGSGSYIARICSPDMIVIILIENGYSISPLGYCVVVDIVRSLSPLQ
jgi:hypothetical protein